MKTEYFVISRQTCDVCNGEGAIFNEEWAERGNDSDLMAALRGARTCEERENLSLIWWDNRGYTEPPPDEYTCDACNGDGFIQQQISLTYAIKELLS